MPTIAEEWPWAHVVHNSCRRDYCHYCMRRCGYGLECGCCEFAVYCNAACQAKAWEMHRPECVFITRCPNNVPCSMVRLFSRVVIKLGSGGEDEEPRFRTNYTNYEKRLFRNLMSHQTRLFVESKRIREFAECCYGLRTFMHNESVPFSTGLMEIFGKIVVNAFSILNDDLNSIGIGIYLNLSQLDHACDAENVVMFDGARALLNCLNPDLVDPSGDLRSHTISYDSVICETESRRRSLQSRYYFTCRCRRCLDLNMDAIGMSSKCADPNCNGHVLLDIETGGGKCDGCSKAVDDLWASTNLMLKVEKENDALEERIPAEMNILSCSQDYYNTAARLLKQEEALLHPYNVHLIRTKFFVAHAAMELSRFDEALKLYEELLPCLKFYVHKNHPTIAVNDIGVGSLLRRKKKWLEAKERFAEAFAIMEHSHGVTHPLRHTVMQFIRNCDRHLANPDETDSGDNSSDEANESASLSSTSSKDDKEQSSTSCPSMKTPKEPYEN
uniref:MYND-type domain-containing protein n=1 Tax=Trichuris muris TaxID=70415 RepID=A0A5S6R508_TRIMR